jgi:hypothetical protein
LSDFKMVAFVFLFDSWISASSSSFRSGT